jgi:hypothetical protein
MYLRRSGSHHHYVFLSCRHTVEENVSVSVSVRVTPRCITPTIGVAAVHAGPGATSDSRRQAQDAETAGLWPGLAAGGRSQQVSRSSGCPHRAAAETSFPEWVAATA